MRNLCFSLIFILMVLQTVGAEVTIKAMHSDYAGQKLDFYFHEDPITLKNKTSFSLSFDQNGNATAKVDINETTCFYADFGIYRGSVFIEPNKNIELKMPPLREKSFADQKNPYFEPITFWFNVVQNDNLNNQVANLTMLVNRYTDQHFEQLFFQKSKEIYDSLLYFVNKDFPESKSQTFKLYRDLSLKAVQADAFRLKPENYASEVLNIPVSSWRNPAFEMLFGKTFNYRLSGVSKTMDGKEVQNAVNSGDLKYLENWVNSVFNLSGDIADLSMLKLLYDAYYSNEFSKTAIEKMVQAPTFKNADKEIIRKAAENIYSKFTFLKQGTIAPTVCLNNLNGEMVCTDTNNGKYKYLIFADIDMIVCREHLKYLTTIDQQFQQNLEIYIVFRNNSKDEIEKFVEENSVPGKLLIDNDEKYTQLYEIRSFPQSFLLDENHKVKLEQTKSPFEGFEQQFAASLRNDFFEQQRNQSR